MHKIIIGTPRSGTSFVAKWYSNKYPQYKLLSEHRLYEHFEPDYADWPELGDVEGINKETQKRINELPVDYIFKMHSGPDMSKLIWDFVYKRPIIIVKRKDLLGQFISYGTGWVTFKWYQYADWKMPLAGLKDGQTFYYKKEWFDAFNKKIKKTLSENKNIIIGGDFNIIPEEIDVYDHKKYHNDALFKLEIRTKFNELINLGFRDAFRLFNKNKREYTFWDYMSGAWQKNHGMRIDHFLVSMNILNKIKNINIDKNPRSNIKPSDHTPIEMEIN